MDAFAGRSATSLTPADASPAHAPVGDTAPKTPTAGGTPANPSGGAAAPVARDVVAEPAAAVPRGRSLWSAHGAFLVALGLAALLRIVTMLGYRWAMWFNDSYDYVSVALRLFPHQIRPDGYPFLLWLLKPFHSFALVTVLQHLMGLAMAVMIYALLRRPGVFRAGAGLPGWAATLATLPVLFDAYEIQLEHLVLSDTLFSFLVVAVITATLWRRGVSVKAALGIGLLLGLAALTRSVGLPLLAVLVVYLIIRRAGWRVVTAVTGACALPLLGYATWYFAWYGRFTLTDSSGIFLYSRTMAFADCAKIHPPVEELALCTATPPDKRPVSQSYIWDRITPLHRIPGRMFSAYANTLAGDFAKRAILAQPLDYVKVVAYDTYRVFWWNRHVFPDPVTYSMYQFGTRSRPIPDWSTAQGATAASDVRAYEQGNAATRIVEPYAQVMRVYQRYVYLRGTLLGVILLIGAAGMAARWRRFGGPALLPWTLAVALLVTPAATAEFDYRYVLPAVPLACLAAAMVLGRDSATARLSRRLRRPGALQGAAPGEAGTGEAGPGEVTSRDGGSRVSTRAAGPAETASVPAAADAAAEATGPRGGSSSRGAA